MTRFAQFSSGTLGTGPPRPSAFQRQKNFSDGRDWCGIVAKETVLFLDPHSNPSMDLGAPNLMSDVAQHRHPRLHRDSGSVAAERNFCFSIWAELTKCIVEMTRAVLGVTFVAQFDLRS